MSQYDGGEWEQDDRDRWESDRLAGLDLLGADRTQLEALNENPGGNIVGLRGNLDLAVEIARTDSVVKLQRWFPELGRGGWEPHLERSGVLGEASAGVEWCYRGVHAVDGAFNGLRATQAEVTVRGFTIMGVEEYDGEPKFKIRRYIDWAGLFSQLGLTLNWRVPLEDVDILQQRAAEAAEAAEAAQG